MLPRTNDESNHPLVPNNRAPRMVFDDFDPVFLTTAGATEGYLSEVFRALESAVIARYPEYHTCHNQQNQENQEHQRSSTDHHSHC